MSTQENALAGTNAIKMQEEFLEKIKVNGKGRSETKQGRNFWQWAKHVWLYLDQLLALKGGHLIVSSDFSIEVP